MSPLLFLSAVVSMTAVAFIAHLTSRKRVRHQLHQLAVELRMAYSPYDRFGLSDRVADRFPIPGAAALRIIDLMYASESGGYRYVFTAEYTIGVIRSKSRVRRVVTFLEKKGQPDVGSWSPIILAAPDLPLMEQYRSLAVNASAGRSSEGAPR